jgi:PAS domain-containing protein
MPPCGRAWPNWKTGWPACTQFEYELQASEVRYRRLFETAKDGILLLDADTGRITNANPFLMGLLGYTHDELLGKRLWEIGPPIQRYHRQPGRVSGITNQGVYPLRQSAAGNQKARANSGGVRQQRLPGEWHESDSV